MNLNAPPAFVALSVLLSLVVVLVLARALWRASVQRMAQTDWPEASLDDQAQTSAAIYQEALGELNAEHAAGQLSESQWRLARAEIAQRLSSELSGDATPLAAPAQRPQGLTRFMQATVLGLLLLLPLSFWLYRQWGETDVMDPDVMALAQADGLSPQALARGLSKRLASRPSDVEAWIVLARVQRAQGQFEQAAQSFEQAYRLTQDPVLNLERVEALAMQHGGHFEGEAASLIQAALAADPNNSRVLLLAGQVSFAMGDFSQALVHWGHLLAQLPPGSEGAQAVQQAMAAARQKGGDLTRPAEAAPPVDQQAQAVLQGHVSLAPALRQQVGPQDTLFITAVAVNGPPMPLAVLRRPARDLLQAPNQTLDFQLDDRLAMSSAASLSAWARQTPEARVWVRARISHSGQALAQSGDLRGQSAALKLGTHGIALEIDETVP